LGEGGLILFTGGESDGDQWTLFATKLATILHRSEGLYEAYARENDEEDGDAPVYTDNPAKIVLVLGTELRTVISEQELRLRVN
jgi:hypothetical protein